MTEPTGPARNSSLRIVKAPGKSFSCREAQTVTANIVPAGPFRHAPFPNLAARMCGNICPFAEMI